MRLPIKIPIVIRNVKIIGPSGSVKVDLLLDSGSASTVLSWSISKSLDMIPL